MTLEDLRDRLDEMTPEELEQEVIIHDGKREVGLIHGTSSEIAGPGKFTLLIMPIPDTE